MISQIKSIYLPCSSVSTAVCLKETVFLQRAKQLNILYLTIQKLEATNKSSTSQSLCVQLSQARCDLWSLLLFQHHWHVRKSKASSYWYGNKAGKLLANQLREKNSKQKIPYLINPTTGKIVFTQKISLMPWVSIIAHYITYKEILLPFNRPIIFLMIS